MKFTGVQDFLKPDALKPGPEKAGLFRPYANRPIPNRNYLVRHDDEHDHTPRLRLLLLPSLHIERVGRVRPKLPKPTRDLSGFSYFGICEKSRKSFGP